MDSAWCCSSHYFNYTWLQQCFKSNSLQTRQVVFQSICLLPESFESCKTIIGSYKIFYFFKSLSFNLTLGRRNICWYFVWNSNDHSFVGIGNRKKDTQTHKTISKPPLHLCRQGLIISDLHICVYFMHCTNLYSKEWTPHKDNEILLWSGSWQRDAISQRTSANAYISIIWKTSYWKLTAHSNTSGAAYRGSPTWIDNNTFCKNAWY